MKNKDDKLLLMKFTSRSRFNQLLDCVNRYVVNAKDKSKMIWLFTFDADDETFDENSFQTFLNNLEVDYKYSVGNSLNKIHAINRDIDIIKEWDVLVNISDDQMPIVSHYDYFIRNEMDEENSLSLWFFDGHQNRVNTQEIVGYNYYKNLGYVYHPSYKSYFCDNEATEVGFALGKMKKIEQSIIRHYHPHWETNSFIKEDDLYRKYQGYWKCDEENYNLRKSQNFPK